MSLTGYAQYTVPYWLESVPAVLTAESAKGPDIPTAYLSSLASSWFLDGRRNSASAGDASASASAGTIAEQNPNSKVLLFTGVKLTMNDPTWFPETPWRTISETGTIIFDEDTTSSGRLFFDQPTPIMEGGKREISVVKFTSLGNVDKLELWEREGVSLEEVEQRLSEGGAGLRAEFSARVDPSGWAEKHSE
jgi:hypothetical protein